MTQLYTGQHLQILECFTFVVLTSNFNPIICQRMIFLSIFANSFWEYSSEFVFVWNEKNVHVEGPGNKENIFLIGKVMITNIQQIS